MNGMRYETGSMFNFDSDPFTGSWHLELPPTSTIGQLSLAAYFELADEANVDLGFTHDEYLDPQGVPRHDDYPDIDTITGVRHAISINNMTRVDWEMRIGSCAATFLLNLFFWDSVF